MDNLFHRVSHYMDIDSRLKLEIPPRKLSSQVISNLESKFPRPQYIYLRNQRKIINFVLAYANKFIILSNVDYNGLYHDYHWFYSNEMIYEIYDDNCVYVSPTSDEHWVTELKPKIIDEV